MCASRRLPQGSLPCEDLQRGERDDTQICAPYLVRANVLRSWECIKEAVGMVIIIKDEDEFLGGHKEETSHRMERLGRGSRCSDASEVDGEEALSTRKVPLFST